MELYLSISTLVLLLTTCVLGALYLITLSERKAAKKVLLHRNKLMNLYRDQVQEVFRAWHKYMDLGTDAARETFAEDVPELLSKATKKDSQYVSAYDSDNP